MTIEPNEQVSVFKAGNDIIIMEPALTFAVIEEDGIVSNIILAKSKAIATLITEKTCVELKETDQIEVGYLWNGEIFVNPNFVDEDISESE